MHSFNPSKLCSMQTTQAQCVPFSCGRELQDTCHNLHQPRSLLSLLCTPPPNSCPAISAALLYAAAESDLSAAATAADNEAKLSCRCDFLELHHLSPLHENAGRDCGDDSDLSTAATRLAMALASNAPPLRSLRLC